MIDARKRLGAYYTPDWLARPLVRWALRGTIGPVLDPSFGGCTLLKAALEHLTTLAGPHGAKYIFGFDVDRTAKRYSDELVASGVPSENITFKDFLLSNPDRRTYHAIVGNPPYVRHHHMNEDAVERARVAMKRAGVELPRMASSWAYFVIHAAEHLARSGRMILLLPGAVLHANYARPVIDYLKSRFSMVQFIHVSDRLFEHALEETVILLAEDYGGRCAHETHAYNVDPGRLNEILDGAEIPADATGDRWKITLLTPRAQAVIQHFFTNSNKLEDLAIIRLGVVTGANDFFVRPLGDEIFDLARASSMAVIASGAQLKHPVLRGSDLLSKRNKRLLLIDQKLATRNRLWKYVRKAERAGLHRRFWCQKREPWYVLDDIASPHIFMPYMGSSAIPSVFNRTRATSTNAVHRVWCHNYSDAERVAFSSWTSLHALAWELLGRNYGGGILKMEPGGARSLPIGIPVELADTDALDCVARSQGILAAKNYADSVLRRHFDLTGSDIDALKESALTLGQRRRKALRL